jgi:hypothetical protein
MSSGESRGAAVARAARPRSRPRFGRSPAAQALRRGAPGRCEGWMAIVARAEASLASRRGPLDTANLLPACLPSARVPRTHL